VPIRLRLTAWYATLLAAILAGIGLFLVLQLRSDLQGVIDREVRDRAANVAELFAEEIVDETSADGIARDFAELCGSAAPGAGTIAELRSPAGELLQSCREGGTHAVLTARVRASARAGRTQLVTVGATRGSERWRTAIAPLRGPFVLIVGESLDGVNDAVERLLVLLLLAGPAALAATALGGWWLARKALLPVERMTSRAREIGIDRLDQRVPVPDTADEIAHLGTTLNAMLARLEQGLEDKHRLVADASHELRTPLAVMRTELDVTLREEDLPEPARPVLESAREEVDRMSRTVDNLLTLAQVDEGRLELLRAPVQLRDAIDLAAGRLATLARAKGIRLQLAGEAPPVTADQQRVEQALMNFIENAIKFSPPGGEVRVEAWSADGEAGVTVTDEGPGLPTGTGDEVFDRFHRAVGGRNSPAGSGLGLAICQEVAAAHGGRVWVERKADGEGSAFSLALPLDRPPPPAAAPTPRRGPVRGATA
jgi:heavy metal sensor kinase